MSRLMEQTTPERRFKAVVYLLAKEPLSVYPSPTAINRAFRGMGYERRRALNTLNGRECRWRGEVLRALGWTHVPGRRPRSWLRPGEGA